MKLLHHLTKIGVIIVIYAIFMLVSLRQCRAQIVDSSFYRWQVFELQENELEYKKCYIIAHPVKSDSDHNFRGKPYVMITRFQKDRSEELSIFGGYEYKLNSEVFVLVDPLQFKLVAKENMAWTKTKAEDLAIITAMLNGGNLKVRSDSAIGTYAVDEYSLKGITRAYARMREICK
ncbi:MAG: hypothetical protein KA100_03780 [Rickettsiales bacterium]|nr:hypothetical protein [Rickettsiales bacterium]